MRVRARTEHKATPITMTTMEIGLRSAARRSHMAMALLVFCHGVTAGKALGRLARRQRQRESRARLDNERAPGFPLYAQLRVREACFLRLFWRHRVRLALCVVVLSGLATPGRSAPSLRVRSPLPQPF